MLLKNNIILIKRAHAREGSSETKHFGGNIWEGMAGFSFNVRIVRIVSDFKKLFVIVC